MKQPRAVPVGAVFNRDLDARSFVQPIAVGNRSQETDFSLFGVARLAP
jgi:hypothetical protein